MQIIKSKDDQVEIKTKNATVYIGDKVMINDIELEGTGEYEIGSISVEGVDDNVYILETEEISIGLVNFKVKVSKEVIEKLSNTSVLVARVNGEVAQAVEQVGQIEPNITFYLGEADSEAKIKSTGASCEAIEQLKFTKSDISEEGKSYFIEMKNGKTQTID